MPAAVMAVTLSAMLATLVALAAPAYPQTTSDLAADEDGNLVGPRPPDYEVDENGLLIIGGDVLMPCSDIGETSGSSGLRRATPKARAEIEQSRIESIQACRAAGFDTAGDMPSDAAALPETGGPGLPAPLLLAALATLVTGLLVTVKRR